MRWNAQLYDEKHHFVSTYGKKALALLQPASGEKILDVGCGTGDLTHILFQAGADVSGVDQSSLMIKEATLKYPYIPFSVHDAHELPYTKEFDAVFSNAALHWMKKPDQVLKNIYKSLKPGGRFVAEFGGKGNIEDISRAIIKQMPNYDPQSFPWYFPSLGEYTSLMEKNGFHVLSAEHFARPTRLDGEDGMQNWITMFGDVLMGAQSPEEKKRITSGAVQELRNTCFHGQYWTADYWRIRVTGLKN